MSLQDDAKKPAPVQAPLVNNPRRKYGPPRDGRMVPCVRFPKTHSHHPALESCPECAGSFWDL